jgi:hypothetical protein
MSLRFELAKKLLSDFCCGLDIIAPLAGDEK